MGKKIDGLVLTIALAAGFYFYFYHSFRNHAAAFILALLCCVLLKKTFRHIFARFTGSRWFLKRRIIKCSGKTIMKIACMPEDEAREILLILLEQEYGAHYPLEVIQSHPSAELSRNRIFEIWKAHRGEDKMVICATCAATGETKAMCSSLREPKIALIDANALRQLIAEHPGDIFCHETAKHLKLPKIRCVLASFINRKNAPRCLLFSASMLIIYVLGGNIWYLCASMIMMLIALVSLHRTGKPSKLF